MDFVNESVGFMIQLKGMAQGMLRVLPALIRTNWNDAPYSEKWLRHGWMDSIPAD